MSTKGLRLPNYVSDILEKDLYSAYRGVADTWNGLPKSRRKQHTERVSLSPEFLAQRAAFQQMWKAMSTDGVRLGYLEYGEDGLEPVVAETLTKVVFDESEAEFAARVLPLAPESELKTVRVGGVIFPKISPARVLGSWTDPI